MSESDVMIRLRTMHAEARADAARIQAGIAELEAVDGRSVVDPVGILRAEVYTGERYPTRIQPLDDLLGGGLAPGFAFAVAGAPGEGKTLLFVEIASELLLQGAVVVILAGDEDRSGIAQRIGQYLGFEKDELNSAHPETLDALEEKLRDHPIRIYPHPDRPMTIEDAEAELESLKAENPGALLVLVIDSIQTVRCSASQPDDAETVAVTKVVEALKAVKKRTGALILATSESPRSSYASKDPGTRTRAIASFAGSRTPEFRFDILAFIGSVTADGADERARLEVTKNRLGHKKGAVTLQLDRDRARWLPIDTAVVEKQREETTARDRHERDQKARFDRRANVKALVLGARDPEKGVSLTTLKEAWKGRATDLLTTLGAMVEEGVLMEFLGPVPVGGGRRPKFYRLGGGSR